MHPASLPRRSLWLGVPLAAALAGCFSASSGGSSSDSGTDVAFGFDGGEDVTTSETGAVPEAGVDAAIDTSVAPPDAAAVDATADAGAADAPVDSQLDAPAEASAGAVYVDPVAGSDSNGGTQAAPFKTIAHAAAALNGADAGAGQTVYLASGTYNAANQGGTLWGTFNRPTFVVGTGSANVIFAGTHTSEIMTFAQGGGLSGVTFQNTWQAFQVQGGTFTASDVVLDGLPGFNVPAVSFVNGAVATLSSTTFTNLNPAAGGQDFPGLYADNTASVTWHATGNTITAAVGHGPFVFARSAAQVSIDGLVMNAYQGYGAELYDQAQLTLTNSTLTAVTPPGGVCSAAQCASIYMGGSQTGIPTGTLVLSGTSITGSTGSAVNYTTAANTGAVSLTFTSSHLDNNAYDGLWIAGASNAALSIDVTSTGTTFDGNGISGITAQPPVKLSLTGGAMNNGGGGAAVGTLSQKPGGVLLQSAAGVSSLTMRGVAFAADTGNLVYVAGGAGTTVDLGTTSSAGGNTFAGVPVGAGVAALNLQALVTAQAVGNTWIPGNQGADATGQYTTATTLTGPANGPNFAGPMGASVVMK